MALRLAYLVLARVLSVLDIAHRPSGSHHLPSCSAASTLAVIAASSVTRPSNFKEINTVHEDQVVPATSGDVEQVIERVVVETRHSDAQTRTLSSLPSTLNLNFTISSNVGGCFYHFASMMYVNPRKLNPPSCCSCGERYGRRWGILLSSKRSARSDSRS